ncbi:MAG: hypothetical protein WBO09_23135 [Methylocystis silviterrae]|uniref:hypothetical protein n=1 Tax=Methylocystis silviterrae TaxID=2743612 RepID=UPI003C7881D5
MSKPGCRAEHGNVKAEPLQPIHALGGGLLELVRKLDALGPCPSLIDLARTMKASQLTAADVAPFVRTNPQSYNRATVVGSHFGGDRKEAGGQAACLNWLSFGHVHSTRCGSPQ